MKTPISSQTILSRLTKLPAFPQIVTQILATLDDDNSSTTTLIHYLQRDPVITGRVMAAANASEHGHRMGGIAAAVSFIGMRRIRDIVLTTSLIDFSRNAHSAQMFLEHCLAVGICTQELAHEFDFNADYALVAGLLHDIGKLWICSQFPKENQQIHSLLIEQPHPLCELEREVFGMDHCAIGEIIGRHWGLPEEIIESIAAHHHPDNPDLGKLAAITYLAESICNGLDLPFRDDNQVIEVSDNAITIAGFDWNRDINDLFGRVDARFQHARSMLR